MGLNEIRVDDEGTVFVGTINDENGIVDVSLANVKQIILLRPDGTYIEEDADLFTDGTDGVLVYVVKSGDINMCGKWRIQWKVGFNNGSWKTDIKTFKVYDNLT